MTQVSVSSLALNQPPPKNYHKNYECSVKFNAHKGSSSSISTLSSIMILLNRKASPCCLHTRQSRKINLRSWKILNFSMKMIKTQTKLILHKNPILMFKTFPPESRPKIITWLDPFAPIQSSLSSCFQSPKSLPLNLASKYLKKIMRRSLQNKW